MRVRDDQARIVRKYRRIERCGDREIEPIAKAAILRPFKIRAKIGVARLDLDDAQDAVGCERDEIGASAVRQGSFANDRKSAGPQIAPGAAGDAFGRVGAAFERRRAFDEDRGHSVSAACRPLHPAWRVAKARATMIGSPHRSATRLVA